MNIVKRISDLALILLPLIALTVLILIFQDATAELDRAWTTQQNGATP